MKGRVNTLTERFINLGQNITHLVWSQTQPTCYHVSALTSKVRRLLTNRYSYNWVALFAGQRHWTTTLSCFLALIRRHGTSKPETNTTASYSWEVSLQFTTPPNDGCSLHNNNVASFIHSSLRWSNTLFMIIVYDVTCQVLPEYFKLFWRSPIRTNHNILL